MNHLPLTAGLQRQKEYFQSGITLPFEYRKKQLLALKQALVEFDREIAEALYRDLHKSPEEAYGTETGLILAEISYCLKNLHRWMKPVKVRTDLINLPSSSFVYRDPLGVVLIIAPFNYPLQLLLEPLVGAIAGGNCVVLKPSEFAPATAAVLEKIIGQAFPPEYVQVVTGDGAEVVPLLMRNFRFDHIFYTGSTTVGRIIYKMAAENLVPVTLELGGKSPCIIEKDANLRVAARRVVFGKFTNCGQTCIAPDYVLVHASRKAEFINCVKEVITQFYTAQPATSYDYGRIINTKQFDRLSTYLKDGTIVHGGEQDRANLYMAPTLLDEVKMDDAVMKEEIFGPVLPLLTFETSEEALQLVERNPDPLALYVFTANEKTERFWKSYGRFGGGCINNTIVHFSNSRLPFGGVGNSGLGAYHGRYSFHVFTRPKTILKTPVWFDPDLKFPPLKGKLKLLKWFIR